MVGFDAGVLIDLFGPNHHGDRKLKLDGLIAALTKQRSKIIIPAPAYAEFLTRADQARSEYASHIERSTQMSIAAFGSRAAVECSIALHDAFSKKEKREVSKTKFKFDWQIVAVAKVEGASIIYTNDEDIVRYANRVQLKAALIDSLEIPAEARQHRLVLPDHEPHDSPQKT